MYYLRYQISYSTKRFSVIFLKLNACIKDYEGIQYLTLFCANGNYKCLLTKYK